MSGLWTIRSLYFCITQSTKSLYLRRQRLIHPLIREFNELNEEMPKTRPIKRVHPPSSKDYVPLDWLQPLRLFEEEASLPSFVDLQQKTRQTLYGSANDDKSPKGSVDEPIRPLVDLINRHSSVCTLSSCSGRLSLFDPNTKGDTNTDAANDDDNTAATTQLPQVESGKGTGGWLLVNHYPVNPDELLQCFNTTSSSDGIVNDDKPWIFKFEPLLLHIAAANLSWGQRLLQYALGLGFRESGLVVSDRRVTVAIRGHSLALGVPLAPNGPLRPSNDFLVALVQQANQKLFQNWIQLDRLYRKLESNLFQLSLQQNQLPTAKATCISPLNLWNVATVAVPGSHNNVNVWAFGGYGIGPSTSATQKQRSCSHRSSNIYKLENYGKTPWSNIEWQKIDAVVPSPETAWASTTMKMQWHSSLPECQGMAACRLSPSGWILLWGGRTSPTRPQETLHLWDPQRQYLGTPISKTSTEIKPTPRWGHSLVALSNNRALLVGGCTYQDKDGGGESCALDDLFLLRWQEDTQSFDWEELCVKLPTPRFHHVTTTVSQQQEETGEDIVFVFGGLESTRAVFDSFFTRPQKETDKGFFWACRIENTSQWSTTSTKEDRAPIDTNAKMLEIQPSSASTKLSSCSRLAAAACTSTLSFVSSSPNVVIFSGGVTGTSTSNDDDLLPLEPCFLSVNSFDDTANLIPVPVNVAKNSALAGAVDFGSLAHHSCVAISSNEFLLLGGGVTSFAFGDSFAK